MTNNLDKTKLLKELEKDIVRAKERMITYNPYNPREAIIYHICKDEAEYTQSLIDVITRGDYDVVI